MPTSSRLAKMTFLCCKCTALKLTFSLSNKRVNRVLPHKNRSESESFAMPLNHPSPTHIAHKSKMSMIVNESKVLTNCNINVRLQTHTDVRSLSRSFSLLLLRYRSGVESSWMGKIGKNRTINDWSKKHTKKKKEKKRIPTQVSSTSITQPKNRYEKEEKKILYWSERQRKA